MFGLAFGKGLIMTLVDGTRVKGSRTAYFLLNESEARTGKKIDKFGVQLTVRIPWPSSNGR